MNIGNLSVSANIAWKTLADIHEFMKYAMDEQKMSIDHF
jgi:hypothetical protein